MPAPRAARTAAGTGIALPTAGWTGGRIRNFSCVAPPATASGFRRRHALACTWPSFFTPSSVTPGKGTARTELPLQPTHSCRKEALAGAELSQKRGSRRSPPCSWPWLTGFWMSFVPMPPVMGCSRSGPGSQSEPKQCSLLQAGLKEWLEGRRAQKEKQRKTPDCAPGAAALRHTSRGSCPTGKACVRQLCAREREAARIRQSRAAPSVTPPCQPLHFRQGGGTGRHQGRSDNSPSQTRAPGPL